MALRQVIFNVHAPRILSRQVSLHHLLVFFTVLTGAPLSCNESSCHLPAYPSSLCSRRFSHFVAANQEKQVSREERLPGREPCLSGVLNPPGPGQARTKWEALISTEGLLARDTESAEAMIQRDHQIFTRFLLASKAVLKEMLPSSTKPSFQYIIEGARSGPRTSRRTRCS